MDDELRRQLPLANSPPHTSGRGNPQENMVSNYKLQRSSPLISIGFLPALRRIHPLLY